MTDLKAAFGPATEGPSSRRSILRTLVVEDSEHDAQLLIRQLTRAGYEPAAERVETAQEMSRLLDEKTWDLIIADYSLPQFSAVQALNLLHE
jgi:DNA-binding response OmpR family regulator